MAKVELADNLQGNLPSRYGSTLHRARKVYTCDDCKRPIAIGAFYWRGIAHYGYASKETFYYHKDCSPQGGYNG